MVFDPISDFFDLLVYLILFSIVALPIASAIFFLVSLILFIVAIANRKRRPEKYTKSRLRSRLILLIVSFATAATVIGGVFALVFTFLSAIAYM